MFEAKIIDFETRRKVGKVVARKENNVPIDNGYFAVAESVLISLYQNFPFHKDFGARHWQEESDDYFRATVYTWGLAFSKHGVCSKQKAFISIDEIVKHSFNPSLSCFIAVYWERHEGIARQHYHTYINWLEARAGITSGGNIGFVEFCNRLKNRA